MAVKPAGLVQPRGVGATGAVHARLRIGAIVAVEGFEHGSSPWPMHHRRGAAGKAFGHRTVFVADLIATAEKPPCKSDRRGFGQGGVQSGEAVIADMDVYKLIDIKRQDPIGLLHDL